MCDKVKVRDLDSNIQASIISLHNARDVSTVKDAVQATTYDETLSISRDGQVASFVNQIRLKLSGGDKFARFGDIGHVLPRSYEQDVDNIRNMAVRSDDVWVVSFPRSGSTWTQELVWLLKNDLDYDSASKIPMLKRYLYLEAIYTITQYTVSPGILNVVLSEMAKLITLFEAIDNAPSSRFIKSHLPFSLLPPRLLDTAKVVYVARDPRDVVVSEYHYDRSMRNYGGDFKTFWNLFIDNLILRAPYFPHLKEAWARRHHPNMLFIFYEDLKRDLPSSVKRVARFLGKEVTDAQMAMLCEHLDIKNFRQNESVNPSGFAHVVNPGTEGFIRTGKTGGWRDYFDEEMTAQAQAWMRENIAGSDLRFPASS